MEKKINEIKATSPLLYLGEGDIEFFKSAADTLTIDYSIIDSLTVVIDIRVPAYTAFYLGKLMSELRCINKGK